MQACLSAFNYKINSCMHTHTHTVTIKFLNEHFMNEHFNSCKIDETDNKVVRNTCNRF